MVHKKYIKIGKKTYGPYYYESYRDYGKIKKKYYRVPEKYRRVKNKINIRFIIIYLALVFILILLTLFNYFDAGPFQKIGPEFLLSPSGSSIGSDGSTILEIYDDSDLDDVSNPGAKIKRYSFCSEYCAQKNKPTSTSWTINFYANYTDNFGSPIDDSQGSCDIRFNSGGGYGPFQSMTYDQNILLWVTSNNFPYKGIQNFEVSCNGSLGSPTVENIFIITNTEPYIFKSASGFIDFNNDGLDDTLRCIEDQICNYNFSLNVSEDDINDLLVYDYSLDEIAQSAKLTDFTLDNDDGNLEIRVMHNDNTGAKQIELNVRDSESPLISSFLKIRVDPVNDPPNFLNLGNKSFNMTELFEYVIFIDDEEKNFPMAFNLKFLDCAIAEWSTRGTNCTLFSQSQYTINNTAINISFTPTRNDVGSYIINLSARDNLDAINSEIVNFTVLNINAEPIFEDICGNLMNGIEDSRFNCFISALDIDEVFALNFSSNVSWFLGNQVVNVGLNTGFRGNAGIDIVPTDANVGQWQINISVIDNGGPVRMNSTVYPLFVDNIHDNVYIDELPDIDVFTTNFYSILFNTSDNDLLIPDKDVYNEIHSFSVNIPWISITNLGVIPGINKTKAVFEFDPSVGGAGTHNVVINAFDNSGNVDSESFIINIIGNNLPVWNVNTPTRHLLTENTSFNLDLLPFVSDLDNDPLSFSYYVAKPFPSYTLDTLTGIIDFIPSDADVGEHIVVINISDGKTAVPLIFNFSVTNIPDLPFIKRPLEGNNITISSLESNMNTSEDMAVEIFVFVTDDDFIIPQDQRSFYQENIGINLQFQGANTNLFTLESQGQIPPNQILFRGAFTPRKSDIGYYNVTVTASDAVGNADFIVFNLSISPINHAPVINNLANMSSTINSRFVFDINSTDIEDGADDNGNFSYRFEYIQGDSLFNETTFNTTNGMIDINFNETNIGKHIIRVIVNDTNGVEDSEEFALLIYGYPIIISPNSSFIFNLSEGNRSAINFNASHFVGDNLTYEFYLHDLLREKISYFGNGVNFTLNITPGFEDETYGNFGNLTLLVYPLDYKFFNATRTWRVNITHSNAPVIFAGLIGDKQGTIGQNILINLTNFFIDIDAFDPHYNQTVNFIIDSSEPESRITYNVIDWMLRLGSSQTAEEKLNVTINDIETGIVLTSAVSNKFNVLFLDPPVVNVPQPTSSSSEIERLVLLKLVLPGQVSIKKGEAIILPISLVNQASIDLNSIKLSSLVAYEGAINNAKASFSSDFISKLKTGMSENLTLTIESNLLEAGLYEVNVNASVASPRYHDWGKIYINVLEGDTLIEKLVFTEEFIADNPECAEIKELVDESKDLFEKGDNNAAVLKLDEAVNACKLTISQKSSFFRGRLSSKLQDKAFIYLAITTILSIMLGFTYYIYKKIVIKRAFLEAQKVDLQDEGSNFGKI